MREKGKGKTTPKLVLAMTPPGLGPPNLPAQLTSKTHKPPHDLTVIMRLALSNSWKHASFAYSWALIVFFGEKLVWWTWSCRWNEGTKVGIIADPQLSDAFSYGQKRGSLGLWLTKTSCDTYMHRAFHHLLSQKPEVVLFLGDLFDGGREWSLEDAQWTDDLQRFARIFHLQSQVAKLPTTNTLRYYYIPGNHDIGLGNHIIPEAYARFVDTFGKPNWGIKLNAATFIGIDSSSLLGGSAGSVIDTTIITDAKGEDEWHQNAKQFIDSISMARGNLTSRILLTHMPMYRPAGTACGPWRGSTRMVDQGSGYQYQNLIDAETSQWILDRIDPVMILSGDDHDWCHVEHNTPSGTANEYTVGAFSWQQGNRRPSYGMLSLDAASNPSITPCHLPDQIGIFITYGTLFALSLLYIFFKHGREWADKQGRTSVPSITIEPDTPSNDPLSTRVHSRRPSAHFGLPPLAPTHDVDLEPGTPDDNVMKRSRSRSRSINLAGRFTSPAGIRMDTLASDENGDTGVAFVDAGVVSVSARVVSGQEQHRAVRELRYRFVSGVAHDVGQCLLGAGLAWWVFLNLDWLF